MPRAIRRHYRTKLLAASLFLFSLFSGGCTRSAPQEPPKRPPPPLEFLGEWGARGDGPGQLSRPASLAVDLVGAVYIADAGSDYVHKFQADGTPLLSFQEPRLASPDEIAVDSGGAIYVTDAARGSVFIFYPDGTRYRERHVVPRRKQKQKQKLGVCVDDAGYVYVLDAATSRVHRFTARGRLVKTWGRKGSGPGQLDSPSNIAVGPDSSLYVTDAGNNRIVKFSREGEFLAAFDAPREPASSGHLAAVAASDRYVFAADSEAHRVYVWTLDGQLKRNEFLSPQPGSQPVVPGDLAAGPRGELFVLDLAGPGVMRFRINF